MKKKRCPNGIARRKSPTLTGSVLKAVDVLECIASLNEAAGVTEVSRKLRLDKSTAYRILSTLEARGYVNQDADTRRYTLGYKILELSHSASEQSGLKKAAAPVLDAVVKECNEAVHLGIPDDGAVFYLDSRNCPQSVGIISRVGLRNPIHCTALGKVLLAFMPEDDAREICRREKMKRFTRRTITDFSVLTKELLRIRRLGYAVDNREFSPHGRCLAAPVRNHSGKVIAALSISAPADRLNNKQVKVLSQKIIARAAKISAGLGYRGKAARDFPCAVPVKSSARRDL